MATHAKRVVLNRQDSLMRMGIVTIQTADPLVPHSAHLKRTVNIVFLVCFTIDEIGVWQIREDLPEMIVKRFPGLETVRCQLLSSSVTASAVIHRQFYVRLCCRRYIIP